jgi:hypothetical protein
VDNGTATAIVRNVQRERLLLRAAGPIAQPATAWAVIAAMVLAQGPLPPSRPVASDRHARGSGIGVGQGRLPAFDTARILPTGGTTVVLPFASNFTGNAYDALFGDRPVLRARADAERTYAFFAGATVANDTPYRVPAPPESFSVYIGRRDRPVDS